LLNGNQSSIGYVAITPEKAAHAATTAAELFTYLRSEPFLKRQHFTPKYFVQYQNFLALREHGIKHAR
jgi:hypothetical protein